MRLHFIHLILNKKLRKILKSFLNGFFIWVNINCFFCCQRKKVFFFNLSILIRLNFVSFSLIVLSLEIGLKFAFFWEESGVVEIEFLSFLWRPSEKFDFQTNWDQFLNRDRAFPTRMKPRALRMVPKALKSCLLITSKKQLKLKSDWSSLKTPPFAM